MHSERYVTLIVIGMLLLLLSSGTIVTFASSEHSPPQNEKNHSTSTTITQTTLSSTTTHNEKDHSSSTTTSTMSTTASHTEKDHSTTTTTTTTTTTSSHTEKEHSTSTTTTTTTTTSSTQSGNEKESHELKYRMSGIGGQSGQSEANIQIQGTALHVNIELVHALGRTVYSIILVAIPAGSGGTSFGTSGMSGTSGVGTTTTASNACNNPIGQLMTGPEGNGMAHVETWLTPGIYQIGIILCIGSNPAIISQPTTQEGIITQSHGNDDNTILKNEAKSISPVNLGPDGNAELNNLEQSGILAAVISGGGFPQLSNVNSNFSAGVGALGASGLMVSLSSANSGSSAVLVNLGNVPITSVLKGLAVTFDGSLANPVSSISEVLNSPVGQSNYVLLQTSSGLALLMSIPHITDEIVQIMPVYSYNWLFISLSAFGSIAAIGAMILLYRKNYLPIPIFR